MTPAREEIRDGLRVADEEGSICHCHRFLVAGFASGSYRKQSSRILRLVDVDAERNISLARFTMLESSCSLKALPAPGTIDPSACIERVALRLPEPSIVYLVPVLPMDVELRWYHGKAYQLVLTCI